MNTGPQGRFTFWCASTREHDHFTDTSTGTPPTHVPSSPDMSMLLTMLDDDALRAIVHAVWTDCKGNLTIVGFWLGKGFRATCKATMAICRACVTPWDGVVTRWIPITVACTYAMQHGFYDHCTIVQKGYNGHVPAEIDGGLMLGRMCGHAYTEEGIETDATSIDETALFGRDGLKELPISDTTILSESIGLRHESGFLKVVRDVETDRILLVHIHGWNHGLDMRVPTNDVAFDVLDVASCIRMFCDHSSASKDWVDLLPYAVRNAAHRIAKPSLDAAAPSNLPLMRVTRTLGIDDGEVVLEPFAPSFWPFAGGAFGFELTAKDSKPVRKGFITNRFVFDEFLFIGANEFFEGGTMNEPALPALLCFPGCPLNAVNPLMTVCGYFEMPDRMNATKLLLHRKTWALPKELKERRCDLERCIYVESSYCLQRQRDLEEEARQQAHSPSPSNGCTTLLVLEDDGGDASPSIKKPRLRESVETRSKIANAVAEDVATYENGQQSSVYNEDADFNDGLKDDRFADSDKEKELEQRQEVYEQQLDELDPDYNGKDQKVEDGKEASVRPKRRIVIDDDEDDEEDDEPLSPSSFEATLEDCLSRAKRMRDLLSSVLPSDDED